MLRESALQYLKTRDAKVGETVQLGWFVFRIVEGRTGIDLESLDFKALASFTSDFHIPEQIHWAQHETLRRVGVEEQPCALTDPALVSRSYTPGGKNTFIERGRPTSETDCGWYVGVVDETLDFTDADSFVHQSLYELTIRDERLARFWLLPVGYRIYFDSEEPRIEEVEQGEPQQPSPAALSAESPVT